MSYKIGLGSLKNCWGRILIIQLWIIKVLSMNWLYKSLQVFSPWTESQSFRTWIPI